MGHREGAPNSLHTLRALPFTVLKTKSKKAVNPSNARSHGSLKPGRAVWGKRSQYSHRGPSLFLQHLHLVPANHADVCSEGSPLLSSSPPRWPAPYVHHDGGTEPSSAPFSARWPHGRAPEQEGTASSPSVALPGPCAAPGDGSIPPGRAAAVQPTGPANHSSWIKRGPSLADTCTQLGQLLFRLLHSVADEQNAQGGCGVSLSGDVQAPPGQGPVQPAVGDPASAGGLD